AEGLVRVVPGVGTVVAEPVGRVPEPAPAAPPAAGPRRTVPSRTGPSRTVPSRTGPARAVPEEALGPDRIVAAAMDVADAEGLAGLSMRRIATALGVAPMALYRHVSDKDDLVVRMLDAAMGEWRAPVDVAGGWRPRLDGGVRALWAAFRRHPWMAQALSVTRPQAIPAGMAYSEWVLATLDGQRVEAVEAFDIHLTLINYVRGAAAVLEPERDAEAASGLDNEAWLAEQEPGLAALVGSGRFPLLQRMVTTDYDLDVDALFERGLLLLLDGLAVQFDRIADASRTAAPPWAR
ncbi:TetR/AcrR family transcriptional regulator, partial [Pseudonocardia oceani]